VLLVEGLSARSSRSNSLALKVHEHNSRARRAYEKCGFTVEGRLREALLWQGRRYDTLLMSMLGTDPRPGR
jgi:RimJ/RimL family protein N-acetyltransferase